MVFSVFSNQRVLPGAVTAVFPDPPDVASQAPSRLVRGIIPAWPRMTLFRHHVNHCKVPIHLFPLSTYIYTYIYIYIYIHIQHIHTYYVYIYIHIYIIYLQNLSIYLFYLLYPTLPYSTLNSSEASHGDPAGGASIGSCRPGAAGLDRKRSHGDGGHLVQP